jgi:hypothetical protein
VPPLCLTAPLGTLRVHLNRIAHRSTTTTACQNVDVSLFFSSFSLFFRRERNRSLCRTPPNTTQHTNITTREKNKNTHISLQKKSEKPHRKFHLPQFEFFVAATCKLTAPSVAELILRCNTTNGVLEKRVRHDAEHVNVTRPLFLSRSLQLTARPSAGGDGSHGGAVRVVSHDEREETLDFRQQSWLVAERNRAPRNARDAQCTTLELVMSTAI